MSDTAVDTVLQSVDFIRICEEELYVKAESQAKTLSHVFHKRGITRTQIKGMEALLNQKGPGDLLLLSDKHRERAEKKSNSDQIDFWKLIKYTDGEQGKKADELLVHYGLNEGTKKELKEKKETVKLHLLKAFYTHFIYECYRKIKTAS